MRKKIKSSSMIFGILLFFVLSCSQTNVYHNRSFRYKIKYPQGWVAINSDHDIEAEEKFKKRILTESIISNYELVDAAFYNPDSDPPIFEQIKIRAEQSRYNVNDLVVSMPQLEEIYNIKLTRNFYNVRSIKSELQDFKSGKIVRFEFMFEFEEREYNANFIIIPGRLYATYFLDSINPVSNSAEFSKIFDDVLNSFHKY